MAAKLLLKAGKTPPKQYTLEQRELGVDTSTDELYLGTRSGVPQKMASTSYVNNMLNTCIKTIYTLNSNTNNSIQLLNGFIGIISVCISVDNDMLTGVYLVQKVGNSGYIITTLGSEECSSYVSLTIDSNDTSVLNINSDYDGEVQILKIHGDANIV